MSENEPRKRVHWTPYERMIRLPETARAAWQHPRPPGYFVGASTYGTVAAPFLAGFAFAAVILIVSLDRPPRFADASIAFFVAATVGFLYAMQFTSWMNVYASPPSARLDWRREAAIDETAFIDERRRHAAELKVATVYLNRLAIAFDSALLAFLVGIGFLVIPYRWSWWRAIALVPIAVALGFELMGYVVRLVRGKLPAIWEPDVDAIKSEMDLDPPDEDALRAAGFRNG